jgi:L-asparagine transporter-like permease
MNTTEIIFCIIGAITVLMLYVSLLTGFFAVYFYDEKKHKHIKTSGDIHLAYGSSILFLAAFFFVVMVVIIFYRELIFGLIAFFVLIFLGTLFHFLVKKNMKNIAEMSGGYKHTVTVQFKKKRYTLLLSPVSTRYFLIALLLVIIGMVAYTIFLY